MLGAAARFHPDLYERVPFCNSFRVFRLTGWVAALYPAFMQPVLPPRAPSMKSADSVPHSDNELEARIGI